MSLILEALRRAEHERRKRGPPGLLEETSRWSPHRAASHRLRLGIALLVVLLAGLALLWAWTQPSTVPSPQIEPAADAPPVPATAPGPILPVAVLDPPRTLARELPPQPLPPPRPADPAAVGMPTIPAPLPAIPAPLPAIDLAGLDPVLRATLPPLRLTMHVHSPDPARRFALIDGRRVQEGDELAPGLVLVAIDPEGLRLDWRGRLLVLRR